MGTQRLHWLGALALLGTTACRGPDAIGGSSAEEDGTAEGTAGPDDAADGDTADSDDDSDADADDTDDDTGDTGEPDDSDDDPHVDEGVGAACEGDPPEFSSMPATEALAGVLYEYVAQATDPDGDEVFYAIETDASLSIHPKTGAIKWIPTSHDVGSLDVTIIATDRSGCTEYQDLTIDVGEENFPPEIVSTPTQSATVGTSYSYAVAIEDPEDDDVTLQVVDGPGSLSVSGSTVSFTPAGGDVGFHDVTIRATDEFGHTAVQSWTLVVGQGGSSSPPSVSISSPGTLQRVSGRVAVNGSVNDADLLGYFIEVCDDEGNGCVEVDNAEGNASGLLGHAHTGVRDNGFARIRVRAIDTALNVSTASVRVEIDSDLKLGHVELAILDMEVPTPGIPLQAVRRYTSLRRGEDLSFGFGWELEMSDGYKLERSRVDGEGWAIEGDFFGGYYLVDDGVPHFYTLRTPDDQLLAFAFIPQASPTTGGQFITPSYEDVLGNGSSMSASGGSNLWILNGTSTIENYSTFQVYNPQDVTITTARGYEYDVDLEDGLQQVSDPRGNTVTVNDNSLSHSSGRSIQIARSGGRINTLTDPAGREVNYFYDADGDLIRVERPDGEVEEYHYRHGHLLYDVVGADGMLLSRKEYDGDGRLIGIINGGGQGTTIEYDDDAQQQTFVDEAGEGTITYDDDGNIVSMATENGATKSFSYDGNGHLDQSVDPVGAVTNYNVRADGKITSVEHPHPGSEPAAWHTTNVSYTFDDRLYEVENGAGARVRYSYTPYGELSSITDEEGRVVTSATYRSDGSLMSETTFAGTRTLTRNSHGDVTAVTDGDTVNFDVDATGRIQSVDYPEGGSADFDVDAMGNIKGATLSTGEEATLELSGGGAWKRYELPNGDVVEREFDTAGRLVRYVGPDGDTKRYLYDDTGRLSAYVDPIGRVTEQVHDSDGRLSELILPDGTSTSYTYDASGRMLSVTAPGGLSSDYSYDAAGRVVTEVDPVGRTTAYDYTPTTVTTTDDLDRSTTTTFFPHGLTQSVAFADGTSRHYDYLVTSAVQSGAEYPTLVQYEGGQQRTFDYDGQVRLTEATNMAGNPYAMGHSGNLMASFTAPSGEQTTFDHDELGNVVGLHHPEGGVTTKEYAVGGTLSRMTLPGGETVDYEYDGFTRVTGVTTSDGDEMSMAYDMAGRMVSMLDDSGGYEYEYDLIDNVSRIDGPEGSAIEYERNAAGQVTAVEVTPTNGATAERTEYEYDDRGLLVSVDDPLGGTTYFSYDDMGRLESRDLPNGVSTDYEYDLRDHISRITHRNGGTVIEDLEYTRNANGAPTTVSYSGGTITYSYDAAQRLASETHTGSVSRAITYSYDASGKRTAHSIDGAATNYQYGDGYDLEATTGAQAGTYEWDASGRMASLTRGGTTIEVEHTVLGNVRSVVVDGETIDYENNGLGSRMKATSSDGERRFVVGSAMAGTVKRPMAVVDGDGAIAASYVFVGYSPLMRIDGSGEPVYYLEDALGSVVAMTDDGGSTEASFHYDAFGNVIGGDNPGDSAPAGTGGDFRFQGHWLEAASGLYHMQMRDYDPMTGLFLSRDPVGTDIMVPETDHQYAFARQAPTLYADPTGGFGLISISISMDISSMMRSAKQAAIQEAKEFILDQIKQFFFQSLLDLTVGVLPGAAQLEEMIANGKDAGKGFEESVFEFLCDGFIEGTPLQYTHWFVLLRNDSDSPTANPVLHDGLSCGDRKEGKKRKNHNHLKDTLHANEADLVIGPNAPSNGGAWIVSDFKVNAKQIKKKKEQFKAMARFARQKGNRIVGYIVWKGAEGFMDNLVGNAYDEFTLFRDAIMQGIAIVILDATAKGDKHHKGFK